MYVNILVGNARNNIEYIDIGNVSDNKVYKRFQVKNGKLSKATYNLIGDEFSDITVIDGMSGYGLLYDFFSGNTKLTSVSFPKLTTIGVNGMYNAFDGCTGLQSVYFPALSEYVMIYNGFSGCFRGCSNLTEIHFPTSLSDYSEEEVFSKENLFWNEEDCHPDLQILFDL